MPYSPQLVISPWNGQLVGGAYAAPAPLRYFLYSVVVCLPGVATASSIVSMSNYISFGSWAIDSNKVTIRLIPATSAPAILDATLSHDSSSVRSHMLMSVDTVTQRLQVYVNDTLLSITGGGWIGSGSTLNPDPAESNWGVYSAGSWSGAPGGGPGVADLWLAFPASFYDLSITANRRKFINADLSLVDLGSNGSEPLGVAPPIFLTVRPGDSNPNHFANNNGTGGAWGIVTPPITFQPGGLCALPTLPASPSSLAMDDIVAIDTTLAALTDVRIFLDWSDNRGHSYLIPVGQTLGPLGDYEASLKWRRLGYARDRVFRLTWSCPVATALQGAWIDLDAQAKT